MNKKVNVDVLENMVSTKYGDLTGLIQIDEHQGSMGIQKLCADKGIELEKYFPIGYGFSDFTINGIGETDTITCSILLLEKEEYGNTFDQIKSKIEYLEVVNVITKRFDVRYAELASYIKRFDCMLLSEMGKYLTKINVKTED